MGAGLCDCGECLRLLLEQAEEDLYGYGACGFCSNKGRQVCVIMVSVCGFFGTNGGRSV
jgi:hypothetical protein